MIESSRTMTIQPTTLDYHFPKGPVSYPPPTCSYTSSIHAMNLMVPIALSVRYKCDYHVLYTDYDLYWCSIQSIHINLYPPMHRHQSRPQQIPCTAQVTLNPSQSTLLQHQSQTEQICRTLPFTKSRPSRLQSEARDSCCSTCNPTKAITQT